jgi:hypothetical protein
MFPSHTTFYFPELWGAHPGGALLMFGVGGGTQVVCMRDILILNEIWAQDNTLVSTLPVLIMV